MSFDQDDNLVLTGVAIPAGSPVLQTDLSIRGLQQPAVAAAGCISTAMGRGGCKYLQEHGYGCGHGCELVTDFSKINYEPKITVCLVK